MTKLALITGGNRGLGRATAVKLLDAGFQVIYTYRDNPGEKIDAVALPLTVGDLESYDGFVTELRTVLREQFGREDFDILINNAGVGLGSTIADATVEDFDRMMNVHLRGMVFLTQKLLPLVADGGKIVNLSTGLARFTGEGLYAIYGALKSAVETFTRYLAREVGPRGITANTIAPGATATEFGGGGLQDENVQKHLAAANVMGRMGQPEDIAGAIVALVGEGTQWITAQRIEVSGGMLI
ncbi:SDR family oxidoreductase [Actinoplanes sp. NPDC051470]|uniref:SDR family NAD(P)-dependent oxidoreductase n=1 Tax=unclassified Actinoplanes TaxID=2626549 RepID=UPI00344630D4